MVHRESKIWKSDLLIFRIIYCASSIALSLALELRTYILSSITRTPYVTTNFYPIFTFYLI